ncbi:MAG: YfhO family protein [Armatimonadota bacterium]
MRARKAIIALIIIALPVGFMYRTLLLGQPLARDDAALMVYPFFHALDEQLAQGQLYLWEPRQICGLPAMARGEVGSLYPPHLLLAWLLPWISALHASYWLHLALGAAGVWWAARNLGASRGASLVGGAAYAFSGYQIAHLVHYAHIIGAAWVPLMLAVLQTALERNRPRWWALLAVAAAMAFAGSHPQVFVMAVTVCALWVLFGFDWRPELARLWRPEEASDEPGRIMPLLLVVAVAGMLAAPQLLPTSDLAAAQGKITSADVEAAVERIASYPFRATDLVRVLLPNFFGTVHSNIIGGGPGWHETNPFTGATPLLLGIAGAIAAFRRRGWAFCVATFVVGAALMPAEGNPIHAALARLPVLGGFRAWGRWMVLPILSLSLLSALAITHLPVATQKLRRGAGRTVAVLAGSIVSIATILWLVFGVDRDGRLWLPGQGGDFPLEVAADAMLNCVTSWEPLLLVGAALITWIVAARLSGGSPARTGAILALLLAVSAPQWYLWQQTNLTVPRAFYAEPPATVAAVVEPGRTVTLAPQLITPAWQPPGANWQERMMAERALLTPALGTIWGVEYAGGYLQGLSTPAAADAWHASHHYAVQVFAGGGEGDPRAFPRFGTPLQRMKRMHRLAAVGHIVTTGEIDDPDLVLTLEGLVNVYSYAEPHARWWLARETVAVPDPAAQLEAIKLRGFDPDRQVIVDREITLEGDPTEEAGSVQPMSETATRLRLRVSCPEPRVLVVADAWYAGWSVTVDGEPAELLRANYAFRGVVLPAGEHDVTFSFRPATWLVALPMFGVGLLVVLALALWPTREPPREGLTPPWGRR